MVVVVVTELVLGGPGKVHPWDEKAPAETQERGENETNNKTLCASASLREILPMTEHELGALIQLRSRP